MNGVSIIICCYNSVRRIRATLDHISKLDVGDLKNLELILVDNNSTDNTASVAIKYWNSLNSKIPMEVVKEKKPGLTYARFKGVRSARYDMILFCDDDNWLASDYLVKAFKFMQMNKNVGMLGGIGIPVFETKEPSWFSKYEGLYAVGKQSYLPGDITYIKGYVYGAGAVFRKNVLENILSSGIELQLTDREKGKLTGGGDMELGYCTAFLGRRVYYDETLKFQHFIPAERLSLNYLKKLQIGYSFTYDYIRSYQTILFSNNEKRRTNRIRLREYIQYTKEIGVTLKRRLFQEIKREDFIFSFYANFNIIFLGIKNWKTYSRIENKIYANSRILKNIRNADILINETSK